MKICIATPLYPPDIGGPATYTKLLCEALPEHGIETEIVSFGEVRHLPKIFRHVIYCGKIFNRSKYCDIIYAQDPVSVGVPARIAAYLRQKTFLLKVVGDYAWEQGTQRFAITEPLDIFVQNKKPHPLPVRLLQWLQTRVAQSSVMVIVPSKYLETVVAKWGIDRKKIKVIYNSFEVPHLSGNREVLRELIQCKGELLISIGRLVPWKGFEMLIDLMPELSKQFPNIKLLIIGNGPLQEQLEKKISEEELEDSVIISRALEYDILMRYMEASDLLILNTRYEGFSHLLLEAMAVGLPILTTNVGGNPELVESGVNGLLVKPNNKKELQSAIESLLKNSAMRQKFSNAGRRTANSFTKERMLAELIPLLQSI